MTQVFALAFTGLTVSGQTLLGLVPRNQPGTLYFATCGISYLVLSILVIAFGEVPGGPWSFARLRAFEVFALCVAAYNVSVWTGSRRAERAFLLAGAVPGTLAVLFGALATAPGLGYLDGQPLLRSGLTIVNFGLASLALGAATTGMILGHWYLVRSRDLTIGPLLVLTRVLLVAVVGQLVATGIGLACLHGSGASGQEALLYRGYAQPFWIRVLVGNLFSLIIAWMSWKTARIESTMSATGLLYILMMTLMAGEMMARWILVNIQILV